MVRGRGEGPAGFLDLTLRFRLTGSGRGAGPHRPWRGAVTAPHADGTRVNAIPHRDPDPVTALAPVLRHG